MADLKGAIDLSGFDFSGRGRTSSARFWSEPEGEQTFIIDPASLGADPFLFGMAMVDAIRHAAIAYSRVVNVSEEQALERIMRGIPGRAREPDRRPATRSPVTMGASTNALDPR